MKLKQKVKIFSAVFILAFFPACVDLPTDVVLPEWDIDLNVPLFKKAFTLSEIIQVDKEPLISEDSVNNIFIIQSDTFKGSSDVTEFLKIEGQMISRGNPIIAGGSDSLAIFFAFTDGSEIEVADIINGSFTFRAVNQSSTESMRISVGVPGIYDLHGTALNIIIDLEPAESQEVIHNLANHFYSEPVNQPEIQNGKIWLNVSAASSALFTRGTLDVEASNLELRSARGYIPRKSLGYEEYGFKLDMGGDVFDFRDKATLKNAELKINGKYVSRYVDIFDVEMNGFKIIGKRNDGEIKELTLNNQTENMRFINGNFSKLFTKENSNINEFVTFMPDTILVSGEYIMNPDDSHDYKTVFHDDSISFTADFSAQSSIALKKSTVIDTTEFTVSKDDREKIRNGKFVKLNIEVENAIPLTAFFKILLLDENYKELFVVTENHSGVDSIQFSGAAIDHNTGEVTAVSASSQIIELNESEILKLADAYYVVTSTSVRSKDAFSNVSNPPFVNLRPSQYINIRSYGNVSYRVNGND